MISLLKKKENKVKNLIALIDGEHYPQVTRDAIEMLKNTFTGRVKGIILLGGTEKLVVNSLDKYFGEKVYTIKDIDHDFIKALWYFKPDIVYDLSDEPVVNYTIRMKIASFCLANECSYMGPDFLFEYEKRDYISSVPTMAVIGTGKRIGKTAVSAFISKMFIKEEKNVCVVAMGRGGPRKPQILEGNKISITPEYLLKLNSRGFHASSDYIEDALVSKVTTIGCRRCGGGFGGKVFMSNVREGVVMAEKLNPDLIILEGSGASLPDVEADAVICVVGAYQKWEDIVGYLGIYRIMLSDLIIITMCEEPMAKESDINLLEERITKINPAAKIIRSVFRPQPLSNIAGRKVFMIMTARKEIESKIKNFVEEKYSCAVTKMSFNLSNREALRKDLEQFGDYDTILTELKAASVDVVTDFAFKNKKDIVYMNNIPVTSDSGESLKKELVKNYNKIKLLKYNKSRNI